MEAVNELEPGPKVAVKVEKASISKTMLKHESEVLKAMQGKTLVLCLSTSFADSPYVVRHHYFGPLTAERDAPQCLVMQLVRYYYPPFNLLIYV